MASFRL
ncbi:URF010 [African swine fever virus]|nr:URF010 [African swine fever virus]